MLVAVVALVLAVGVAIAVGDDAAPPAPGGEHFVVVPPGAVPAGRPDPRSAGAIYDLGHGRVGAAAEDFGDGVVQQHVEIQVIR